MAATRIIIPPPCEPLSLDAARAQLRVDADMTRDDVLIRAAIAAARSHIETTLRRALVMRTSRFTMDGFPGAGRARLQGAGLESGGGGWVGGVYASARAQPNVMLDDPAIELYGGPLQSVLAIQYLDTSGALQTLDSSLYTVDLENDPARIMPANADGSAGGWPAALAQINAVTITAAAGWMTPATADPDTDVITLAAGARAPSNGDGLYLTAIDGELPDNLEHRTLYYVIDVSGATFKISETPGGSAVDIGAGGTGTLLVDALPTDIRHALKMLVSFFYENRGETGGSGASVGDAIEALLSPHRVWRF